MGTHNTLHVEVRCPHCQETLRQKAETLFGFGSLLEYQIGSEVRWIPGKQPQNGGRPPDGNLIDEGYIECSRCGRDFFIDVSIVNDKIESIEVSKKKGFIK